MEQGQGQSEGRTIGDPAVIVTAIVLFAVAVALTMCVSIFLHLREEARRSTCVASLSQIGNHMLMYVEDHSGAFPPPDAWNKPILIERMHGYRDFCPNAPGSGPSYAMNAHLRGLRIEDVKSPERTAMLFESDRGKNLSGGPELLPTPSHHKAGHNIAFVDGHVETVPAGKVADLIWDSGK